MKKPVKAIIEVQGSVVNILSEKQQDYICLTDIARHRNPEGTDDLIRNWLRNRNTIEFLGIWEKLYNPDFNPVEFDGIKMQAGLNSFSLTAKQWRDSNPQLDGNMRDHATIEQLLVLANVESLNAEFIHMQLSPAIRLTRLNAVAIRQMGILTTSTAKLLTAPDKP